MPPEGKFEEIGRGAVEVFRYNDLGYAWGGRFPVGTTTVIDVAMRPDLTGQEFESPFVLLGRHRTFDPFDLHVNRHRVLPEEAGWGGCYFTRRLSRGRQKSG